MEKHSPLVRFYLGVRPDSRGRTFRNVINQDDSDFEGEHDFIQWLFPLIEPSAAVPDSPVLSPQDIDDFHRYHLLAKHLLQAYHRFLEFLGLRYDADTTQVQLVNENRANKRIIRRNHNWQRITRVLTSLRLLGLSKESAVLYKYLAKTEPEVCPVTFKYWTDTQAQ